MLADKCGSCDHNLNVIYCNIRYLFMQLPSDIYRQTDCENVRITESDILYYIWLYKVKELNTLKYLDYSFLCMYRCALLLFFD